MDILGVLIITVSPAAMTKSLPAETVIVPIPGHSAVTWPSPNKLTVIGYLTDSMGIPPTGVTRLTIAATLLIASVAPREFIHFIKNLDYITPKEVFDAMEIKI